METRLACKDRSVIINPDQPFAIIGEQINPTRRKKLAESMAQGDFSVVQENARKQVEAGAHILGVKAVVPGADELALLRGAVQAVMEVVQVPLCFDSANPEALKAVPEIDPGKALINSTTAEKSMLQRVLPPAKQYGAAVIGVITDESGIPAEDVVIDCLTLTVGADHKAGQLTLDSIALVRDVLGVNLSLVPAAYRSVCQIAR